MTVLLFFYPVAFVLTNDYTFLYGNYRYSRSVVTE